MAWNPYNSNDYAGHPGTPAGPSVAAQIVAYQLAQEAVLPRVRDVLRLLDPRGLETLVEGSLYFRIGDSLVEVVYQVWMKTSMEHMLSLEGSHTMQCSRSFPTSLLTRTLDEVRAWASKE